MQRKIKVVALNIASFRNSKNPEYRKFQQLSAVEKINFLGKHIENICGQLSETSAPGELWKIGFEEYAIKEPDSRFVTLDVLTHYKQTFQALTKKYPNLMINAGTIAVKRPFAGELALKRLASAEQEHLHNEKLINEADAFQFCSLSRIADLRQQIMREVKENKETKVKDDKKTEKVIYATSNTNYVFYQDQEFKHRKVALFNETTDLTAGSVERRDCFFCPGGKKGNNQKFKVVHPSSPHTVSFAREICRENDAGKKLTTPDDKSDIHWVCSNTISLTPDKFYGKYVIQFDSLYRTQLISTEEKTDPTLSVELYEYGPFDTATKLRGPLQPFYPLELRIYNLLEQAATHSPTDKHKELFNAISKRFLLLVQGSLSLDGAEALIEGYFEVELKKFTPFSVVPANDPVVMKNTILHLIRTAYADSHFQLLNTRFPAPLNAERTDSTCKSSEPDVAVPSHVEEMSSSDLPSTPVTEEKKTSTFSLDSAYEYVRNFITDRMKRINAIKNPHDQIREIFTILEEWIPTYLKVKLLENLSSKTLLECLCHSLLPSDRTIRINLILIAMEKKQQELINLDHSLVLDEIKNFISFFSNIRNLSEVDQAFVNYVKMGIDLIRDQIKLANSEDKITLLLEALVKLNTPEAYNNLIKDLPVKLIAALLNDKRATQLESHVRNELITLLIKSDVEHHFIPSHFINAWLTVYSSEATHTSEHKVPEAKDSLEWIRKKLHPSSSTVTLELFINDSKNRLNSYQELEFLLLEYNKSRQKGGKRSNWYSHLRLWDLPPTMSDKSNAIKAIILFFLGDKRNGILAGNFNLITPEVLKTALDGNVKKILKLKSNAVEELIIAEGMRREALRNANAEDVKNQYLRQSKRGVVVSPGAGPRLRGHV